MPTVGIGISTPGRIKQVESEHCMFLYMPVDVPCVNRKDCSIANVAKSILLNDFLVEG